MADFLPAFEKTLLNEGGYKLTNDPADRGGQTYAGIARKRWPAWPGWRAIDAGDAPPSDLVRDFYRDNFWGAVQGDQIAAQDVAETLYDNAVNAGAGTAAKLAQIVVGATPDGKVGPKTLAALNQADPAAFRLAYALAMIARYRDICARDASQRRFLLGWINRALKVAA